MRFHKPSSQGRSPLQALLFLSVIAALVLGPSGAAVQANPAVPDVHAPAPGPAQQPIRGTVVRAARTLPEMDAPPAQADATVVDKRSPEWVTRYGTEAGHKLLPPRQPAFEAAPAGPAVELGAWQSLVIGGSATINAIISNWDGRLFAAVDGDGLRVYGPGADGSYGWTAIRAGGGPASNNVTSLAILNNELWVASWDAGISLMNLSTGTWRYFNTGNSGLASNDVVRLTVTDDYSYEWELWASTANGASIYSNDGSNETWNTVLGGKFVFDAVLRVVNSFGVYWVATSDGVYYQGGGGWTALSPGQTGACDMGRASRMVVDNQGTIWFANQTFTPALAKTKPQSPDYWNDQGVCSYSAGGTWTAYNATVPGLPSNSASDIAVDGAGRVWISFRGVAPYGGVAAYDQGTWLILQQSGGSPLQSNDVTAIQAVGETVWFGYYHVTGLDGYSPNWQRTDFTTVFGNSTPQALFVDQTVTWAGVGNDLLWYDGSAWHRQAMPTTSAITSFTRDVSNTLWIGTAGGGLYTFDGSTFTNQNTGNGLPSNDVRALLSDHAGRLWAATSGGLALRGKGYWLALTQANSGLNSNDLRALAVDATDRLWIGTANNGIDVFNPNARGVSPWSTQTVADGLPSNTIHALTTDPAGAIWAATAAGIGERDAMTTTWKTPIPTEALSIASDPAGRIWAGTTQGLVLHEGGGWQGFHATASALGDDRVVAVATDGTLMWAAAGTFVSVRGILTGPIGFYPPTISSFTPTQGGPFSVITVNGSNFDARGPAFNTIRFSDYNGIQNIPGQVLTANANQLTVQVPALANTGQLLVTSHHLNGQSSDPFTIVPVINSLSSTCVGLGSELDIHGYGFTGAGSTSAYVKIGDGPWRYADARDPSEIRQFIRPGDTAGPISVRLGSSGPVALSGDSIAIAAPQVDSVAVQQGVQGLQMIWGKRTLVQLALKSVGAACNSHVDSGFLEWKKKDGTTLADYGAWVAMPSGLVVSPLAPAISLATTASFVAGKEFVQVPFALSDFDGMRIHLTNGPVELFTYDIPASAFGFLDTGTRFHVLNVQVYPTFLATNAEYAQFLSDADAGLQAAARAFPQQDMEAYFGPNEWMEWAARTVGLGSPVNLSSDDTFHDLQDQVDDIRTDINDEGGNFDQAVALIDQNLYAPGSPRGKATFKCGFLSDCDQQTTVSFNLPGQFVMPYLQEIIHASHWVDSGSPNYASYNATHSRYDEAQRTDICTPNRTYRQALQDQLGYVPRVVALDWAKEPVEFSLAGCDPANQPRSIMSYAPSDNNSNTFLEPVDYNHELAYILLPFLTSQADQTAAPVAAGQTLRLAGTIDASDRVTVTMSYLLGAGQTTPPTDGGAFHLYLRTANGAIVMDEPFNVGSGSSLSEVATHFRFNLRVPFPAGVTLAEMWHNGARIWSRAVSAHSPSVSFTGPNGGTFDAGGTVPVTWTASHPDGVALQFLLDYSPDNGTTWITLATGLTGLSYDWRPGFVPPGTQARLRLRASDGFHVATAVSAPFGLTARAPVAVIRSPQPNSSFTEGQSIDLSGGSMTADGPDNSTFQWQYDGADLGSGQNLSYTPDRVGTHVFTLRVTSHGLSSTQSVSVTVLADFSHSGIPDAWQLKYGLNPLDPTQAFGDPIGKGLTNLQQYQLGLNPLVADTDGNGGSDAAEIAAGLDPLKPDQKLPTVSALAVGAESVGFSMRYGAPAPAPWHIWVTNGGTGSLTWSATGAPRWLTVTPLQGDAPSQVTIAVRPSGLLTGTYTSKLTFRAPGAAGSPHVVDVTLNVGMEARYRVYLPVMVRRGR